MRDPRYQVNRSLEELDLDPGGTDPSVVIAKMTDAFTTSWRTAYPDRPLDPTMIRFGFFEQTLADRKRIVFTAHVEPPETEQPPALPDGSPHDERCWTRPQGDALVMFSGQGVLHVDHASVEQIARWSAEILGGSTLGARLLHARLVDAAERAEAAYLTPPKLHVEMRGTGS